METPSKEKWVGVFKNACIESHLKLGALLDYIWGESIVTNIIAILLPLILSYTSGYLFKIVMPI